MSTQQRKIPIPLRQRLDDFRRGPLQLLIWGGTALLAFLLLERQQIVEFQILGIVRSLESEVSTPVDGRLVEVLVEPFDDVVAGDIVARLDDSLLQARIATSLAAIESLSMQLEVERRALDVQLANDRARLQSDYEFEKHRHRTELRRFWINEEDRLLEKLAVDVQIEAALVQRDLLDLRILRTRPLVEADATSLNVLDNLELERDRVEATIEGNRKLASTFAAAHEAAIARRVAYQADVPQAPLELLGTPLHASIRAETLRVEEIRVQRGALLLTVPFAGRISRVLAANGQALLAGEPVAMVTSAHADEVMAYLPEAASEPLYPGTRMLVSPRDWPALSAEATVTRLGPSVELLPQRLWQDPVIPEYGRPFLCVGLGGLDLMPGQVARLELAD